MERVALPDEITCTDFLLELNNILKDNTTLKWIYTRSGLFFPLSASNQKHQWTGRQQFNVGAVGSGRSPNLSRSFSSSDLTQPQTLLFWERSNYLLSSDSDNKPAEVDFKKLFSERKNLFSLPSFTAPDTDVLESFSGLDPRLKHCLGIFQLKEKYVAGIRETCWGILRKVSQYLRNTDLLLQ